MVQNTARLEAAARERPFDGLAGTLSVFEAARRITSLTTTVRVLRRVWKPVAQPVDRRMFGRLFGEKGHLRWSSQAFAETCPEAEIDSLRPELFRNRELVIFRRPQNPPGKCCEITDSVANRS